MRLYRLVSIAILLWPTTGALAADDSSPDSEQVASSQPDSQDSRYEGYLYLDIEGKPLPIQSDAEIEAFLAEAEIVETSLVGAGITLPRKVQLQGNGFRAHAIFKYGDVERHKVKETINGRNHFSLDWYDSHRFDDAAYELDRLLGMDRVPPAVPRSIGADFGTIRIWLEKTITEYKRSRKLELPPPDYRRWHQQHLLMRLFDNLAANRDSNLGNLLIDPNWRLWFIDCTRCFGNTTAMYVPLKQFSHCERGFWIGLKKLDAASAQEHLSPFLNKAELRALLARRDLMVKHFQKLIDEKGQAAVLYEILPSTERAPWGDD